MKGIYDSLRWALTESARQELALLEQSGLDSDLAFALIDHEVLIGNRPEEEVYDLTTTSNETTRSPRRTA